MLAAGRCGVVSPMPTTSMRRSALSFRRRVGRRIGWTSWTTCCVVRCLRGSSGHLLLSHAVLRGVLRPQAFALGGVNAAAAILGINASRLEPNSSLGGCPTRFMPGPAHLVTVETADDSGLRARETVAVVIAPSDYLPTKVVRPVHGPKGEITTPPDLTVRAALAI
jgi:hypothetical protein